MGTPTPLLPLPTKKGPRINLCITKITLSKRTERTSEIDSWFCYTTNVSKICSFFPFFPILKDTTNVTNIFLLKELRLNVCVSSFPALEN